MLLDAVLSQGANAAIDYIISTFQGVCGASPVECHFVDVRGLGVTPGGDLVHATPEVRA